MKFTNWVAIALCLTAYCAFTGCERDPVSMVLTYQTDPAAASAVGTADVKSIVEAVNERLGSDGRAKVLNDDQLEVELYGEVDEARLESLKLRIGSMGDLEFRILADSRQPKDQAIIDQAKFAPSGQNNIKLDDKKVAEWVRYAEAEFGPADAQDDGTIKRKVGGQGEALVLIDSMNVTGQYLASAENGLDSGSNPAVLITFNQNGARRFYRLTKENEPNRETPDLNRRLGIILDKRLISAPVIVTAIGDRAAISGGSITEHDVGSIIAIFNSGVLPYPIRLVDEEWVAE